MKIKVSRVLHAGYIFECEGDKILFDPIFENPFSRNCHAFPNVKFDQDEIRNLHFSAVFISHFHDDHCSFESLDLLNRKTPIYVYCLFDKLFDLIRELGFINVHPLKIDMSLTVGPFEVIPRRALDDEVDSMFQVRAGGLNILNVVDAWIDHETLELLAKNAPWDLVLWPFQTMRELDVIAPSRAMATSTQLPIEWIEQLRTLNPRYIVPSSCQFIQESWSWYNGALFPISYRQFKQEVEATLPEACVLRMNPAVTVLLTKDSLEMVSELSWIQPLGEQEVDYDYKHNLKPPPTGEIAKNFAPLTAAQTARVYDYCHTGLLEKYQSLEDPTDSYFNKPRLWRLSVYDHMGRPKDFYYRVSRGAIAQASRDDGMLSWTTEVPIFKFFSALEFGEALTSMYMRINDTEFSLEIEKEIQSADIVEDPLIRCLFNGTFGSYQQDQLNRIKAREA